MCARMIPQAAADEADLENRFPPISSNGQLTISSKNEVLEGDGGGGECTDEMGGNCKLRGRGSLTNASTLKQTPPHPRAGGKPCCFCWCCCCTCSWCRSCEQRSESEQPHEAQGEGEDGQEPLDNVPSTEGLAVKANESGCRNRNESVILEQGNCDAEPRASLDEIRCWGKSFDKLMRSPAGRNVFREFLRCEYSEENILFWLACEELKREGNPDVIEEKARFIYEDYISILSPKEVSLDSRVREVVNRNMVSPTPHTFDEAQLQIYTLMHRDSYPRFVNSPLYKKLAQINNNTDVNDTGSTGEAQKSTKS